MNRILGKAHSQRRRQTTEHSVSQSEPAAVTAAERLVRPTNLAWALADAAKPHLNAAERSDVYMSIGAGETFTAIKDRRGAICS